MAIATSLLSVYDKHYKPLMLVTLVVVILAIALLFGNYFMTGDFVNKGVSLKGGITVTVPVQSVVDTAAVQTVLEKNFPAADVSVRGITQAGQVTGIIIEATELDEAQLVSALQTVGITTTKGQYSIESMGSALGTEFFKQTTRALILAFVFMAIVVFITFRVPVPSFFVVLAAFSDIMCTLAIVTLFGVKLSTAGIAALLMLIGYSVDTDILLTNELLKSGRVNHTESIHKAMKTGLTMTGTSIMALLAMLFVSGSIVIEQIALTLLIGLLIDMPATWFTNAGFLRLWLERKHRLTGVPQ